MPRTIAAHDDPIARLPEALRGRAKKSRPAAVPTTGSAVSHAYFKPTLESSITLSMLTSLRIVGFKAFGDTTIPLSPLTVLVGENGVGKSTVLQAIELMSALTRKRIPEYLAEREWEYADLVHLKSAGRRFGFEALVALEEVGETKWSLYLESRRRPGIWLEKVENSDQVWIERHGRAITRWHMNDGVTETLTVTLPMSALALLDQEDREEGSDFLVPVDLVLWASGVEAYLFLDPRLMRGASRESHTIGAAGASLAGFLARLEQREPRAFKRVVRRVSRYYPRLRELHIKRKAAGWREVEVTERWGKESVRLNARQVSDGLLRLLAIAAMHELEHPPSVILLDEIENGIHPRLLGAFVEMMQELVDARHGRLQVIMATHSPLVVNYVREASQVLVVHRDASGAGTVTRLDRTRGFRELRGHMDLGELWYNAGEAHLVGPRSKSS